MRRYSTNEETKQIYNYSCVLIFLSLFLYLIARLPDATALPHHMPVCTCICVSNCRWSTSCAL